MTRREDDLRNCRRKKAYPSYSSAKTTREVMAARGDDVTVLHVYRCPVPTGADHWHLGHAHGQERKRLEKRAEKQRRKAAVRSLAAVSE